ncbi:hypothetical protein SALBM311S_02074 [Streptomyces alboniger]
MPAPHGTSSTPQITPHVQRATPSPAQPSLSAEQATAPAQQGFAPASPGTSSAQRPTAAPVPVPPARVGTTKGTPAISRLAALAARPVILTRDRHRRRSATPYRNRTHRMQPHATRSGRGTSGVRLSPNGRRSYAPGISHGIAPAPPPHTDRASCKPRDAFPSSARYEGRMSSTEQAHVIRFSARRDLTWSATIQPNILDLSPHDHPDLLGPLHQSRRRLAIINESVDNTYGDRILDQLARYEIEHPDPLRVPGGEGLEPGVGRDVRFRNGRAGRESDRRTRRRPIPDDR